MIQNWEMFYAEKSQPVIETMTTIFGVVFLSIVLVIVYYSYIGNCRMIHLFFFCQLLFVPCSFIIAVLPTCYSLIALGASFLVAYFSRFTEASLYELNRGILSSNPRYRNKEEKAFSRLTEEEKKEWIKKHEESQVKRVPLWVTFAVVFPPYLIGIAVTALIPQ